MKKQDIINGITCGTIYFCQLDYIYRADKDVVLAAVKKDGRNLQYASKKLQSDKEVVLAAISNYGKALQYASRKFRLDKEIVLAAVSNDGMALRYASQKLKSDIEVVFVAVQNNRDALMFADSSIRALISKKAKSILNASRLTGLSIIDYRPIINGLIDGMLNIKDNPSERKITYLAIIYILLGIKDYPKLVEELGNKVNTSFDKSIRQK